MVWGTVSPTYGMSTLAWPRVAISGVVEYSTAAGVQVNHIHPKQEPHTIITKYRYMRYTIDTLCNYCWSFVSP